MLVQTARVLVVHLVKVFRVRLYQWRAKRYSQFPQMFEPKEWRKKTKHELKPLMLIDLKDDTLGDVFSQSGKCS